MDSSCSHVTCDVYEEANKVSFKSITENKTDIEASVLKNNKCSTKVGQEQIDDIERKDFEEENSLLNHCSNILVNNRKSSPFSGNLSSANSSLASSSETISSLTNNVTSEIPGCSNCLNNYDDSNTTIKNMINSKTFMYSSETASLNNLNDTTSKNDFVRDMYNRHCSTSRFKLDRFKFMTADTSETEINKMFKTSNENVKSSKISGGVVIEKRELQLSGIEKLNDSSISSENVNINRPLPKPSVVRVLNFDEPLHVRKRPELFSDANEDLDEGIEELWCTCLSSLEDEEDVDYETDSMSNEEENRIWRKRKYDEPSVSTSLESIKKFCSEESSDDMNAVNSDRPVNLPVPNNTDTSHGQEPHEMNQWLNRFQSWSNCEKIQAIDSLISRCAASQVRHMMKAIEPLFQRDFISLLPKELALTVLSYLQPKDLLQAAQTCRYWRFLADDNLLWKEQCRRVGITTYKKIPRYLPRCTTPWKAAYMRQDLIEKNWLTKPVQEAIVMRGHDDHVITCLQFYGNRILSGSDDTTLKVWSAITGKCLRTLYGHSGGVWSSQMVGDLIISGSTDRTLRVWNAKSGKCSKILAGHTSTVRCMHLYRNRVVSGSRDTTLRVWSIPEGRCLCVLVGHLAAVRCVQYDGKVVVSGAYDYFVKVWNPETGECLHTLAGHTNRVYSLQFDGVNVVSGSLDTSIRVWDVVSGQLKHTLTGHQSLTSGMELLSNILVSGNADSTVKVWDINTGHCLHTLSGPNKHKSAVTCLQSTNRFVVTSSDDGTVKLWDVRTGEFIRNLLELDSGGSGGVVWRIRASSTKLVCAVGSRNGTEDTKLLVLDFDVPGACVKCDE